MASRLRFNVARLLPHNLYRIIQNHLAAKRRKKNNSIEARLQDIRNILTYCNPISLLPPATGKLRLLQDGNTVLLAHFAKICESQGLRYWMDYGTLLGAVRHKGFIPWDDDLDVSMMRPEYERLIANLPRLFPKEKGFSWSTHAFLQIGFNGTPLNIDVYPYHFYSESLSAKNKFDLDKRLTQFKKTVVFVPPHINFTDDELQKKIKIEILENKNSALESHKPGIFLSPAITFTKNTILEYDDIFPLRQLDFEGLRIHAPNHSRSYLQFFYGDYMSYPSNVGYKHPSVERMVRDTPFDDAVNKFIDIYGQ